MSSDDSRYRKSRSRLTSCCSQCSPCNQDHGPISRAQFEPPSQACSKDPRLLRSNWAWLGAGKMRTTLPSIVCTVDCTTSVHVFRWQTPQSFLFADEGTVYHDGRSHTRLTKRWLTVVNSVIPYQNTASKPTLRFQTANPHRIKEPIDDRAPDGHDWDDLHRLVQHRFGRPHLSQL